MADYRILGPVELWSAGNATDTGQPRQRLVLAALLIDAGRQVPAETLVDRVWGESPPAEARATLRTYIARIRRMLEQAGAGVGSVVRAAGSYALTVDPDQVDLHTFRQLSRRARDPGCPDAERVKLYREALALWRGAPLAGLPGEWAARTRATLEQERLDATVAWAQAELAFDNPGAVLGPLADAAGDHPLAEPVAAALMRALYSVGRTAEALARYTAISGRLADELGIDPGPDLQELHRAILRGDLGPPRGATPARQPSPGAVVPAQLPADVFGFAGRADLLATLDGLLTDAADRPSTSVVISAVSGTAGVGKTALALHWSHRVRERFPDGQLYINLRGFAPGGHLVSPTTALRRFLDALGVRPDRIPADLDAQTALYRSLLAGKRILVVLDNARNAEQVRPLLPGTATAVAVVTSRNRLTGLVAADGAHPVSLDVLSMAEARDLLARRLGTARVAAEPEAVERIVTACAALPLALTIAAARAQQTGFPLADLAAEFGDADRRLDPLVTDDSATDVRTVFSWSYSALTEPAARLFRLLGLHAGPDIPVAAAASLLGRPPPATRPLLTELTGANLVVEHAAGRYTFHDLLNAYAADLASTHDDEEHLRAARSRLLDYYVHAAYAAERLLAPVRGAISLPLAPPADGVVAQTHADARAAGAWLAGEYAVLLATLMNDTGPGSDARRWQLAWSLNTFLDREGHWHDRLAAWRAVLPAAQRLGDAPAEAHGHRQLANANTRLGNYLDADTDHRRALEIFVKAGDRTGEAATHNNLAILWSRQGDFPKALEHAREDLEIRVAEGDRSGQASALNAVGWCLAQLGDLVGALAACRESLALHREVGDRFGQAAAWDSVGYIHHRLGEYREAGDCYRHALDLVRELGNRSEEAEVLDRIGDNHRAIGDAAAARTAWAGALRIYTDLDQPVAGDVRAKLDESA